MNLSRRERWIAIAALGVVILLGFDSWIFTPLADKYNADVALRSELQDSLTAEQLLYNRRDIINDRFQSRLDAGLSLTAPESESSLLGELEGFSKTSGLQISTMRTRRQSQQGELGLTSCQLRAQGTMAQLAEFLWAVAQSPAPLSVKAMDITCPDDTVDQLSVDMEVAAAFLLPQEKEGGR